MWSKDNKQYKHLWTQEKDEAFTSIIERGVLPPQYDFIIVNDVIGRSIDILDTTFQDWICNSTVYEDVGQFLRARFCPERKFLLRGAAVYFETAIPNIYYEWHSIKELRQLIGIYPLLDDNRKPYKSWNAFAREGKVEKRIYGRNKEVQYRVRVV